MVHLADADALVGGETQHFPDTIRPALQVIKPRSGLHKVSGSYALVTRRGDLFFLADCTVNIEPSAEDLAKSLFLRRKPLADSNVTPRGHAVVFEFRQHTTSINRESAPRNGTGAQSRSRTDD